MALGATDSSVGGDRSRRIENLGPDLNGTVTDQNCPNQVRSPATAQPAPAINRRRRRTPCGMVQPTQRPARSQKGHIPELSNVLGTKVMQRLEVLSIP